MAIFIWLTLFEMKGCYISECGAAKAQNLECAGFDGALDIVLRVRSPDREEGQSRCIGTYARASDTSEGGVEPPHPKSCGCAEFSAKRECLVYALVTIFHSNTSRRPGRRRGRFAQALVARGYHSSTFGWNLFVFADWTTDRSESDADSARRD